MVSCWKGKKNWSHSYLLTGMDSAARLKMIWAQYWHLKILKGNPIFNGYLYKWEDKADFFFSVYPVILKMIYLYALCWSSLCKYVQTHIPLHGGDLKNQSFFCIHLLLSPPLHYERHNAWSLLYIHFKLILLKMMQTAQAKIFYYFGHVTSFFFFLNLLHTAY